MREIESKIRLILYIQYRLEYNIVLEIYYTHYMKDMIVYSDMLFKISMKDGFIIINMISLV